MSIMEITHWQGQDRVNAQLVKAPISVTIKGQANVKYLYGGQWPVGPDGEPVKVDRAFVTVNAVKLQRNGKKKPDPQVWFQGRQVAS